MLDKGPGFAADEVILDLEDSVPAELKEEARAAVADALRDRTAWAAPTVAVRINAVTTEWYEADLAAVASGADCVIVPKAESAADVVGVARLLEDAERAGSASRTTGIEALIESARGLRNLHEIAESSERLEALILGPADMSVSLGFPSPDEGPRWAPIRISVLVAARAAGLQAIDGPFLQVADADGARASAAIARELGFDGKWALHPSQVESLNGTFAPGTAEVAQAEAILATLAGEASRGAVMLDGEMIDEASRKRAEQILARAGGG